MIAARSRKAGARPSREDRLESCARPGAKARSVRSYRVHWLTRRRRFNAATLRASIGFPFASRRPLPTIDPSPLSGAITDGGGPARIRSSPSNVVQSALVHEALVDHEAAVVADALAADRVDVQRKAATVR